MKKGLWEKGLAVLIFNNNTVFPSVGTSIFLINEFGYGSKTSYYVAAFDTIYENLLDTIPLNSKLGVIVSDRFIESFVNIS